MGEIQHPIAPASKLPLHIEQSRQFDIDGARYLVVKTFEASIDRIYTV